MSTATPAAPAVTDARHYPIHTFDSWARAVAAGVTEQARRKESDSVQLPVRVYEKPADAAAEDFEFFLYIETPFGTLCIHN